MKIFFLFSLMFIIYTYLGYPALLFIKAKLFPKSIYKKSNAKLPFVSVVIATKNEAANIQQRLNNLLEIEYPKSLFEIILVSDGSNDDTNQLVKRYTNSHKNIHLISYFPSQGKPFALNMGVRKALGEIIVFADSRQRFQKKAVAELVENFNDPHVGCVSGELILYDSHDSSIKKEMGTYWHYEKIIRKLESKSGSVVGATGAIYAIRKTLYKDIPCKTILDDVLTPMNIVMQGYRCIFEPSAVAYDSVSKNIESEMTRKIRTLAGNWQLLRLEPGILLPCNNKISIVTKFSWIQ
jgi:poly-beta-1,6-N-acetyl-D-glucosamine synthase